MSDESSIVALREVVRKAKAGGRAKARRQTQASWMDGWQIDGSGRPLANLFNALVALRGGDAAVRTHKHRRVQHFIVCEHLTKKLALRRGL
jgi:hypothetical protein